MATIEIYAIDRDNGDGRYVRRHAFVPLGATCIHYRNDLGLVTHDDLDGGQVATLTAPEGSRIENDLLVLPGGERLDADSALETATHRRGYLRMGLAVTTGTAR